MKNVMGVIYTGENDANLRELTLTRAIAALPVGGRYRVIDFLLSSMVNGGIKNVGVIMQKNYHSLMDHIGSGKEWDLHGKNDGLKVLPPFLTRENVGVYSGMLDALRSNTNYLSRSKQEYLVLSNSTIIYNANIAEFVAWRKHHFLNFRFIKLHIFEHRNAERAGFARAGWRNCVHVRAGHHQRNRLRLHGRWRREPHVFDGAQHFFGQIHLFKRGGKLVRFGQNLLLPGFTHGIRESPCSADLGRTCCRGRECLPISGQPHPLCSQ